MSNSDPLRTFSVAGPDLSPDAMSYNGHVEPALQERQAQLTNSHSLAIFHYVTRSRADFVERKIKMRGGMYATQFAALAAESADSGVVLNLSATFDAFEAAHGFDGQHEICKQGARLSDAVKKSAHPTTPR